MNSRGATGTVIQSKSENGHLEPPILHAIPLPPISTYERVIIDEEDEQGQLFALPDETTPLIPGVTDQQQTHTHVPIDEDGDDVKSQNVSCRDWQFAVLFYVQLFLVLYAGIVYSPQGYQNIDQFLNYTFIRDYVKKESDDVTPEQWEQLDQFVTQASDYISEYWLRILLWNFVPSALLGYEFVHMAVLFVIPPYAKQVVQGFLVFTVLLSMVIALMGIVSSPSLGALVVGGILVLGVLYYVRLVWPIVPFAAVNLKVASIGINSNTGTHLWAFFSCKLGLLWILYWLYATGGIMFYLDDQCCESKGNDCTNFDPKTSQDIDDDCGQGKIFLLLLICGYWTNQVIMNTVEVTVAGVMATWCFDKEAASGCCSPAVASSLYRSATYSFGSICLGSLLQGIVQGLRKIIPDHRSRRSTEHDQLCCGLCYCVLECFGRVLEDVLDYFHQWAYVFVGIYGYGYVESGRKVLELFISKGWTTIISERLASYVTACITIAVGISTGVSVWLLTLLVDAMHDPESSNSIFVESSEPESYVYGSLPREISFFVGFALGSITASVMMSVVRGGMNTLIVCFADSPAQLEENHPELTREIVQAWAQAFPETISKNVLEPPTAVATSLVY